MRIYIRLETSARDLEGRLLLGVELARRGHDVYLGAISPELLVKLNAPPGLFHDTNPLDVPSYFDCRAELRSRGFLLTFQDEENALNEGEDSLRHYWRQRTSTRAIQQFDLFFAWGDLDSQVVGGLYPEIAQRIMKFGSPRIDAWRASARRHAPRPAAGGGEPPGSRILIASNYVVWATPISSYAQLKAFRSMEPPNRGLNLPANVVIDYEANLQRLAALTSATETLVETFGAHRVLFRPHPAEDSHFWREFFTIHKGLEIDNEPPLRTQFDKSLVLVHTNCTTAVQARIAGVPVISWLPTGQTPVGFDRLGRQVNSEADLVSAVKDLEAEGSTEHSEITDDEAVFLDSIVVNWRQEDALSSVLMADAMESVGGGIAPATAVSDAAEWVFHARLTAHGVVRDPLLEALSVRLPLKRLQYRRTRNRMPPVDDNAREYVGVHPGLRGTSVQSLGPRIVKLLAPPT